MKKVLVPLMEGFEEVEALTVIDLLRRAEIEVLVAGPEKGLVEGRSAIRVWVDLGFDQVDQKTLDMIVLPGGKLGVENLQNNETIRSILRAMDQESKYIGAICSAPTILCAMEIFATKAKKTKLTSDPNFRSAIFGNVEYLEDRVVVDGNFVTSQSVGTSLEFAMKLIELLRGKFEMEALNKSILARLE